MRATPINMLLKTDAVMRKLTTRMTLSAVLTRRTDAMRMEKRIGAFPHCREMSVENL
jgi:hypothetical protein